MWKLRSLHTVCGDVFARVQTHVQGTPVKLRDGPAAVIDVMESCFHQMLHFLYAIVGSLRRVTRPRGADEKACNGHIGSQKTYHLPGAM